MFRIIYGGSRRNSVSWTLRGRSEAIRLTLHHGWRLHREATGEECPWAELLDMPWAPSRPNTVLGECFPTPSKLFTICMAAGVS